MAKHLGAVERRRCQASEKLDGVYRAADREKRDRMDIQVQSRGAASEAGLDAMS
ncbi:hypothetical protein X742_01550 [Mesorhizobium sp. LNHC232B00]|nr:hypothetical protein X742_01550 [Mesorhizobium sp. LNHC232B00]